MQLSTSDVAKICEVSVSQVFKWVQEEGLPAEQVNCSCRVNPMDLLEWASNRMLHVSPALFTQLNGASAGAESLSCALQAGGVVRDIAGKDRSAILEALVEGLSLTEGFDRDSLVRLIAAREHMGGTTIGGGIAIPHPRTPVALPGSERLMRLAFLAEPLDLGAADGKKVEAMFLLVCPTVRDHLEQLAKLASALRDEKLRSIVMGRASTETILEEFQRVEATFQEQA